MLRIIATLGTVGRLTYLMKMSMLENVIQAHHERNRELLRLIANKGADPSVPCAIDLHFWATNEENARGLSAALEARGYSPVSTNRAVADLSLWNVETHVQASPFSVASPAFVVDLVQLACAHGGEFDGWGTSI